MPITPTKSPDPKKQCSKDQVTGGTSNNDNILKAVLELTNRFTTLEQKFPRNTDAITVVCDQLKVVEIQAQKNGKQMKELSDQVSKLQQRSDEAKHYGRRWNLWLYVRAENMNLFVALPPEEKEKMGFIVDTVQSWSTQKQLK